MAEIAQIDPSKPSPAITRMGSEIVRDEQLYTRRSGDLADKSAAIGAEREKVLAPMEADLQARMAEPTPQREKVEIPQFQPKPVIDAKDYEALSYGLIAMAMIGGVASQGKWLEVGSVLNGALKGYLDGNELEAKKAYKDYDEQFKGAIAKERQANREFEDILKDKHMRIGDQINAYRIVAAKYDRQDAMAAVQSRSLDRMWQSIESRKTAMTRLEEAHERATGRLTGGASGGLTDATKDLHGDEFLAKLSPLDRNTVSGLVGYDIDPKTIPGGMIVVDGQKRSRREYMIALARQVDPNYSETAYREKQIALSEFQRTKGNATRFLNVSIDHIDTAAEYAKALKNGDVPRLNQLKNWWQTNTGQAAPNTFNGIKDIVASEVIKGAIGGPGGVEERKENAAKVKAANSPEQLDELFMGWKKLMAGQMKGLEKAYESGTRLKNFREKYMLPRARKALEEVSGEEGGAPVPSGPKAGNVEGGYKFKGGDPADKSNWEKQ